MAKKKIKDYLSELLEKAKRAREDFVPPRLQDIVTETKAKGLPMLKQQYSKENILRSLDPTQNLQTAFKTFLYEPEEKKLLPSSPAHDIAEISRLGGVKTPEGRQKATELATNIAFFVSNAPKSAPMPKGRIRIADEIGLQKAKLAKTPKQLPAKAGELPMGKEAISQAEKTFISQQKISQARAGVIDKLKQKPMDRGILEGTPLGAQIPTPLEEAIQAKPVGDKGGVGKELAKEARKYKSADEFAEKSDLIFQGVGPNMKTEFWTHDIDIARAYAEKKAFRGKGKINVSKFSEIPEDAKIIHSDTLDQLFGGNLLEDFRSGKFDKFLDRQLTKKEFFKFFDEITSGTKDIKPLTSVKTTTQLTDIYSKAQPPTPQPLKAVGKLPAPIESLNMVKNAIYQGEDQSAKELYKNLENMHTLPAYDVMTKEVELMQKAESAGIDTIAEKTGKYKDIYKQMGTIFRYLGEKKNTATGLLNREHITRDTKIPFSGGEIGMSSDELAEAIGFESENDLMADFANTVGSRGEAKTPTYIRPVGTTGRKLQNIYDTLDKRFFKILEDWIPPIEQGVVPSDKRFSEARRLVDIPAAVSVEPTFEMRQRLATKNRKAFEKEQDRLFKEWQSSYKSETLTSMQALNKSLIDMKKMTDQGVRARLMEETKKVFAPDFRTPEFVLEKMGLREKVYVPLKDGMDKVADEITNYTMMANNWWNQIGKSKKGSTRIFKFLDGQTGPETLNEKELVVAGRIKDYLAEWADRLELPADRRIADYITHIFEPDFEKGKVFPQEIARILDFVTPNKAYNPFLVERLGAKGYKQDVFEALDAYVYRGANKLHLDKPLKTISQLVDFLPQQSSKYVDNLLKRFVGRPDEFEKFLDNNILQPLPDSIKNKLGNRPFKKMVRTLQSQIFRGTLGFNPGSAMRNLTQGINTFAELGTKYTAVGYAQLLEKGVGELVKENVLGDMIIAEHKNTKYRSSIAKMDKALFYFFETAEKINRGSAYFGAKQKYLDEGVDEKEAIKKSKDKVRKTQFGYGKLDTPLALQTAAGRLGFTLATYPLKQFEFVGGMVKNKELPNLARYILSSLFMVTAIGDYVGIDFKDAFFRNIVPTLGIVPKFIKDVAFTPEWKREKAVKNIAGILAIPAYTTGKRLKPIWEGESRTAPSETYPKGQRRFTIETPEEIIRTLLTGEYSTEKAREYLIKKKIISDRSFIDDLLYIVTGEDEFAPPKDKKETKLPNKPPIFRKQLPKKPSLKPFQWK